MAKQRRAPAPIGRQSGDWRAGPRVVVVWVLVAGAICLLGGCQQLGCYQGGDVDNGESSRQTRPWLADATALRSVPSEASVVVGVRRAAYLGKVLAHLGARSRRPAEARQGPDVESGSSGDADRRADETSDAGRTADERPDVSWAGARTRELNTLVGAVASPDRLEAGVEAAAPAIVFRADGRWTIGGDVGGRGEWVEAMEAHGVEWVGSSVGDRVGVWTGRQGGRVAMCLFRDSWFAASMGADSSADEMCGALVPESSGPLEEAWTSGWTRGPEEASLVASLVGGGEVAAGLVRPGVWLRQSARPNEQDRGRAGTLTARLASQLGALGWTMQHRPDEEALSVTMRLQQTAGEPMAVANLGSATGSLPPMGGLVSRDVLGAVRLSANPQLAYQLMRSLLPAQTRRDVDAYWRGFRSEMNMELPESLLHAVAGHAVVVVFRVRPKERVLRGAADGAEEWQVLWRRLVHGEATREAVMIPITDREAIERVLNVATQLSQGKLSRDKAKASVHYAWIGSEGLSWALVLTDEYVVFADSGVAFNRAVNFARDAAPIGGELRRRGIHRLFDGQTRSGFFIQAGRARSRLARAGWKEVARWMAPLEWVLLTSETAGGEGIGRLDLGYGRGESHGK